MDWNIVYQLLTNLACLVAGFGVGSFYSYRYISRHRKSSGLTEGKKGLIFAIAIALLAVGTVFQTLNTSNRAQEIAEEQAQCNKEFTDTMKARAEISNRMRENIDEFVRGVGDALASAKGSDYIFEGKFQDLLDEYNADSDRLTRKINQNPYPSENCSGSSE